VEYTREKAPQKVFDLRLEDPHQLVMWQTFGGEKVPSLYPAGLVRQETLRRD